MPDRSELTRDVDDAPRGPLVGAFFDLDRTLLAGFSVTTFFLDGILSGRMGAAAVAGSLLAGIRFQTGQLRFSGLLAQAASLLAGQPEEEMAAIGERLFVERLAADVYPEAMALVQAHQRAGHTVAIVSSATRYQIAPLARELGIEHVLCTELEVRDGRFTGEIVRPTCYGEGKLRAAERLSTVTGVRLADSFFYTDSEEDLPLLDGVGRPRPTNPSRALAAIAARRGWPQRRFASRGMPSATDVVRTGLGMGALVPSLLLGVPAAVLDGRWKTAVNVATATWGELGTALAGITLTVRGEEHLWSQRPAVFIFNHQSGVEPLLLCKLLHRDFTGVGKMEIKRHPLFGPAFSLAGVVFVDRADHVQAVKALEPAVQALREGTSLVIAPEGTRSTLGKLGHFKKGAFRVAMAADVPIVPIVFRNSFDVLPRHAWVARPATVDVCVLPPIETRDWAVERLPEEMARVEARYRDTLEHWPS